MALQIVKIINNCLFTLLLFEDANALHLSIHSKLQYLNE